MIAAAATLEPGIYRDLSMEDYLALPAMSASKLEKLRRSPLQLQHSLAQPPKTSDALERGTALHLAILEPALFGARYVVAEPCEALLRTGARAGQGCGNPGLLLRRGVGWVCGQHTGRDFVDGRDEGAEVITADNDARVRGMAAAVRAHARARTLFEGRGDVEATVVFRDPETGVICRIRPDRLVERAGMYTALKTTRDASTWAFPADAERRGYFRSLAFYRRGLRAIGWPYQCASVVAVESEPPYDLQCYLLDEGHPAGALETADREVSRLLRIYQMCVESNEYPGYSPDLFTTLARPAWATRQEENGDG